MSAQSEKLTSELIAAAQERRAQRDRELPELEDAVVERVREWVRRAAPILEQSLEREGYGGTAKLEITLFEPDWGSDEVPMLSAGFEETLRTADLDGRVTRKAGQ